MTTANKKVIDNKMKQLDELIKTNREIRRKTKDFREWIKAEKKKAYYQEKDLFDGLTKEQARSVNHIIRTQNDFDYTQIVAEYSEDELDRKVEDMAFYQRRCCDSLNEFIRRLEGSK